MILYELCQRDVVNLETGQNLGRVDDLQFDEHTAVVTHLIIYGRMKFFGLLGREEDTSIPWEAIRKIGDDVILVQSDVKAASKKHGFQFLKFW